MGLGMWGDVSGPNGGKKKWGRGSSLELGFVKLCDLGSVRESRIYQTSKETGNSFVGGKGQ